MLSPSIIVLITYSIPRFLVIFEYHQVPSNAASLTISTLLTPALPLYGNHIDIIMLTWPFCVEMGFLGPQSLGLGWVWVVRKLFLIPSPS